MSRTYRVRHLPRLNAKKFVEGRGNYGYRRRDAFAEAIFKKSFPYAFNERGRLLFSHWGLWWSMREVIRRENPMPVASLTQHPWVDWGRTCAVKTEYKRSGNRIVRRHNRAVLRSFAYLGDEVDEGQRFYDKKDGWNIYTLY